MDELALDLCQCLIVRLGLFGNGLLHSLQHLYLLLHLSVFCDLRGADAGSCTALVHKVNSLVGEETVCDISFREHSADSYEVV